MRLIVDGSKVSVHHQYVHRLLPAEVGVLLAGDSKFRAMAMLRQLRSWRWDYMLRQRGNFLACVGQTSGSQPLAQPVLRKDKVFWYPRALLTEQFCPTRLLAYWRRGGKEAWPLSSNLPHPDAVLRAYCLRMWVERRRRSIERS